LSSSSGKPGSNGHRAAAVQRLKAAVAERKQTRDRREAGKGTDDNEAVVSARAADAQVSARKRSLKWAGDRDEK
jgi:hypothetical protein